MSDFFLEIGHALAYGGEQPFGLFLDGCQHHLYCVGKTGVGKSTLLKNILVQHILAGHGVGIIDPHGDVAESLLDHIPPWRTDDVIYFNPSDFEHPIGLNLLHNVSRDARHLVVSSVVSAFKNIWGDSWGPRLEFLFSNALAALSECQNVSLLGINRLLIDPQYRRWVMNQVSDPVVRAFWMFEYENYDPRFMREAIAPIQNKVGQFLMHAPLRNILGQVRNQIDFRKIMDEKKIFIANLAKGKLGDGPINLLGSILTAQFQAAAMSRANVSEEDRKQFTLGIDEFQSFTTESFGSILSEARKYRLNLILANQFVAQLTPEVRQSIFGNVGSIVAFRVGYADADILEKEFGGEYPARQFTDLGRFEVMARLFKHGEPSNALFGRTLPPPTAKFQNRSNLLVRSREYSTPRNEVEDKINRWLGVVQ